MVYWSIFGAWRKKNKSADVIWRGFDAICVCVFNRSRLTTNENAHRSHVLYKYIYYFDSRVHPAERLKRFSPHWSHFTPRTPGRQTHLPTSLQETPREPSLLQLQAKKEASSCYKENKGEVIRVILHFRGWTIKSHSPGYEIGLINRRL